MLQRIINLIVEKRMLTYFSTNFIGRPIDALIIVSMLYLAGVVYKDPVQDLNVVAWMIAVIVYSIVAEVAGVYRSYRDEELPSRIARLCSIWLITVAVLLLVAFITKTTDSFSRITSSLWFLFTAVALSAWHTFVGTILRLARAKGHNTRRAALVGVTDISVNLARNVLQRPWMGIELVGYFEERKRDRIPNLDSSLGSFLGDYHQLVESAKNGELDIIYISLPMRAEYRINNLIERLGTTTASIYIAHSFGGFNLLPANCAPRWNQIGGVSVLGVVESPFHGILGWVKQLEDMILGAVLLTISALPMIFVAVAIRLTSKGPIFFRQTRYGLNGQKINVLKFRTMKVCENGAEVRQAQKNDERVTRLGRFLRRTSLDELPQFFHVMTGKMSIVGPRPHAVAHNEQYRHLIEYYMVRHKVKPGITGWAQVNGWRGETDTDEKMKKRLEYDLLYIRNWTLMFDFKIIFLTVFGSKTHHNVY